jgi:hypothetical protein
MFYEERDAPIKGRIAGALGSVLRWGFEPLRWIWSKIKSRGGRKPVALSFVLDEPQSRWSVARLGDKPGTHVHGHFYVTNTSDGDVMILKARLHKYPTDLLHVFTRHPEQNVYGRFPVLSHQMSEVTADFSFFPPIGRDRKALVADVIFTDNFGHEHRLLSLRFGYIGPG